MLRFFEEANMLSPLKKLTCYSLCIHTPPWWSVLMEDSGRGHGACIEPVLPPGKAG